jgi:cytoskeletal protein RodZ
MAPTDKDRHSTNFKAASSASSKMLIIVAVAVIVGILLVWVVNNKKDNNSSKTAKSTASTVLTTVPTTDSVSKSSSTTSTTTAVPNTQKPADVSVLVLNGSNFAGVAGNTSTEIGKVGYKMLTPGDDKSQDVGTFVYYKSGFDADAKKIAQNILPSILKTLKITQDIEVKQFPSSTPSEWSVDELLNANIVVIVGNAS